MRPGAPTALDDFLFDLNGFLVLHDAVDERLLQALDAEFDAFPRDLERGNWYRGGQRRDYTSETGFELHQAVAAGEAFEELIDHPSWIGHVRHFAGEEDSYVEGITIDETIASIRSSGGHHPVHSGGHRSAVRTQYRVEHGVFRCGLVNVILALTDIGEGDGATMVVPGSHKSSFLHPAAGSYAAGDRMDALPGAVPATSGAATRCSSSTRSCTAGRPGRARRAPRRDLPVRARLGHEPVRLRLRPGVDRRASRGAPGDRAAVPPVRTRDTREPVT